MKYFFILGSNPSLSIAELAASLDLAATAKEVSVLANSQALIIDQEQALDVSALIRRLGGTIKIGLIKAEAKKTTDDLLATLKSLTKIPDKKFYFGFSSYVRDLNVKPLAMEFKKYFKENMVSCRWVISKEAVLSSVVVEQNDLLKNGAEFVFFQQGDKILVGQTLVVQPFKELSFRDYGRPARDDYSGMLPPKLAQIMINLARPGKEAVIFDPFCGSGTVLSEASLMGYKNLLASDISARAISDTKKNLDWIRSQFNVEGIKYKSFNQSATKLSNFIGHDSVDAIVTEPYLGPQRGQHDIRQIVKELEELYSDSLGEFYKLLKAGGRVVMIWPVFRDKASGNIMLKKGIANKFKIITPLPGKLAVESLRLSNRQTIIYGRVDQRVWREVVILEK